METKKPETITQIEKRLNELKAEREALLEQASSIKGSYLSSYEIRPAGRHVLTIGEELIQDEYAAIVELVKNCYDADSPDATIVFRRIATDDCLEIQVIDHGHGMSTDDIINKWLVPSTSYKQGVRSSPQGRIMQGRKGIGRYAASILGDDLRLHTTDKSGQETIIYLNWDELANHQYLDQINIPISSKKTNNSSGTTITIHSQFSQNTYWTSSAFQKLRFELKKLIPPKPDGLPESDFRIVLQFDNFFTDPSENTIETIEPYPILDFFDYRISGTISSDGSGSLVYENQKVKNSTNETIDFAYGPTGCGTLSIDIRVYDRDKDAIDQLILRGLQDERGEYVSKQQARQLLNDVNGIGVYRNGFRIRPLGDSEFDWLKLNERRVQNPSMRIGSNQVVGYIHVESEEQSGLEEKSARDGLKSNSAYDALKSIVHEVIAELEGRRFAFRRSLDLTTGTKKLERQLDGLYDYDPLKKSISSTLKKAGITPSVIDEISSLITKEEIKKNEAIEEIKRAVAIYQGQATLGKIVNIILHEGRRPLNYFKNQIPNLHFYGKQFLTHHNSESFEEVVRLTNGVAENASIFVGLFGRLDPLAAKRRETKKKFSLRKSILGATAVFEKECADSDITIHIDCPDKLSFIGWEQDIYTIIVNLLDNSLFWIKEKNCVTRQILISVIETSSGFTLNYTDSGPGISDELLVDSVIFEPQFTTKPNGTGLGLSIAGEAATRNGLTLTAVQNENGAHFVLTTEEKG